jgi:type IV pilus assembly protein PilW
MQAYKKMVNVRKQQGISLIELMISMALGLFLLAGLSYAFITMNNTAITRKNLSDLNDTQRISMYLLTSFLQQTGYYIYATGVTATSAFPAETVTGGGGTVTFAAGQTVSGTSGTSDTISVRYFANADFPQGTCSNVSSSSSNVKYSDVFSINSTGSLICEETAGSTYSSRVIADNVSNMQVTYGVESGSNSGSVNVYVTDPSLFPATYPWSAIKTVTITLTYVYKDKDLSTGLTSTKNFSRTIPVMNAVI